MKLIMNLPLYSILAIAMIGLSSCVSEPLVRDIRGEWAMNSFTSTSLLISEGRNVSFLVAETTSTANDISLVMTFDRDGNFMSTGNYDVNSTTVLANQTLYNDTEDANRLIEGSYTIDEGTVTFVQAGKEPITGTVEISNSVMTMTFEEDIRESGVSSSESVTVEEITTVITFTEE